MSLQVPRQELPPEEWFSIKAIVRDLELYERDWAADLLAGYFCQASAPWERGDRLPRASTVVKCGNLSNATDVSESNVSIISI